MVEPDIAERVLEADLNNAAKQVAEGKTLPSTKRQLFLDVITDGEDPQGIIEVRETALLRKFASGGRLKKEELEEIEHLLPGGAQSPEKVFKKTYGQYATLYDASERTVKYWVSQGKRNPNGAGLPPLDDPVAMPAWWAGTMKQKCPDNILTAAKIAAQNRPAISSPFPSTTKELATGSAQQKADEVPLVDVVMVSAGGPEENLKNLRWQTALAYNELVAAQAVKPADAASVEQARRRWMPLNEALNKAEDDIIKWREKSGRYIDKVELSAELVSMFGSVADAIRSLRRRLKPKLLQAADEAEEDAIWQAGIDGVFAELEASDYAQPFKLEAA